MTRAVRRAQRGGGRGVAGGHLARHAPSSRVRTTRQQRHGLSADQGHGTGQGCGGRSARARSERPQPLRHKYGSTQLQNCRIAGSQDQRFMHPRPMPAPLYMPCHMNTVAQGNARRRLKRVSVSMFTLTRFTLISPPASHLATDTCHATLSSPPARPHAPVLR